MRVVRILMNCNIHMPAEELVCEVVGYRQRDRRLLRPPLPALLATASASRHRAGGGISSGRCGRSTGRCLLSLVITLAFLRRLAFLFFFLFILVFVFIFILPFPPPPQTLLLHVRGVRFRRWRGKLRGSLSCGINNDKKKKNRNRGIDS